MPIYRITVTNDDFRSTEEQDFGDGDLAAKGALKGALAIGSEQLCKGLPFFGAIVSIDQGNERIGRYVVALGASQLKD